MGGRATGEKAKKGKVSLILIFHTPALHLVFFHSHFPLFFPPPIMAHSSRASVCWTSFFFFLPSYIFIPSTAPHIVASTWPARRRSFASPNLITLREVGPPPF